MATYVVIRELPCIVGRAGKPDAIVAPVGQTVNTADPAIARAYQIYGTRHFA